MSPSGRRMYASFLGSRSVTRRLIFFFLGGGRASGTQRRSRSQYQARRTGITGRCCVWVACDFGCCPRTSMSGSSLPCAHCARSAPRGDGTTCTRRGAGRRGALLRDGYPRRDGAGPRSGVPPCARGADPASDGCVSGDAPTPRRGQQRALPQASRHTCVIRWWTQPSASS